MILIGEKVWKLDFPKIDIEISSLAKLALPTNSGVFQRIHPLSMYSAESFESDASLFSKLSWISLKNKRLLKFEGAS